MDNMSHQHAEILKDESTESKIGSHQLPTPLSILPEDVDVTSYLAT
jgi:hypothetical protein